MDNSKLFYVLNGLLNGEKGVRAMRAGGGTDADQMRDGHYYLLDDDTDGRGPFVSRDEAWDAGLKAERTQVWAFPISEDPDEKPFKLNDVMIPEDCNVASIEEVFAGNQSEYYEARLEGSYETLTLRISCPSFDAAADVYHHLLRASHKYQ